MKTEIKKDELNEMSSGGGGSVGDGGATGNNSGAYSTPTAWSASNASRKFFKNTMVRGSKIVKGGLPNNNISMEESTSLDTLLEEFNTLMSELDAEPSLNTNPQGQTQQNVFTYHIVTNNENDFYADVRDPNGNTKFELNDMGEVNSLISDGIMKSKEDIEGLAKYLKSKHILGNQDLLQIGELNEGNVFDNELAIGNEVIVNSGGLVGDKNLIGQTGIIKDINNHLVGVMLDKGGYSKFNKADVRKKDSTVPIKNSMNEKNEEETVSMPVIKRHFDVIAEDAKPNGLIQAERIKGINNQNSLNYYKTLNNGIQDMIAADKPVMGDIEPTIKYEYDNNGGEKVTNGVYPDEKENNDEYLATANRGIGDYILDVPNDKYEERLKKMTTNKKLYNMIKDKQKVIKNLDLRNMPKGKMEVVPHSVNESFMSGYYFDMYGNKKIKTFNLSNVTETESLNENFKHFETKGVGNIFNEIIKEEIEKYNFYYDAADNQLMKISKEKDSNKYGNFLNESVIKKMTYLNNYDPSKNVKNLVDRNRL